MSSTLVEPELLFAGAKAHNRWLSELCQESPERRCGVALIPVTHDVDRAVTDVKDARDIGLKAELIPSMWNDKAPYHDPMYDPFWAACQDLDMPIHTHSGSAPHTEYGPPGPGHTGMYVAEVRWWAARPIHFLLWSGVFERFPRLKYVITELGARWVPELLGMLEIFMGAVRQGALGEFRYEEGQAPAKTAMEYFHQNCWVGVSMAGPEDVAVRDTVGIDRFMWGSDYPHDEGTYPNTTKSLRRAFRVIPHDETRKMLADNAAALYGFDLDKLAPLAAEVGPLVEDVHRARAS
jgi:predicted TIM-barrel fold metal-dependent hydrolase